MFIKSETTGRYAEVRCPLFHADMSAFALKYRSYPTATYFKLALGLFSVTIGRSAVIE